MDIGNSLVLPLQHYKHDYNGTDYPPECRHADADIYVGYAEYASCEQDCEGCDYVGTT